MYFDVKVMFWKPLKLFSYLFQLGNYGYIAYVMLFLCYVISAELKQLCHDRRAIFWRNLKVHSVGFWSILKFHLTVLLNNENKLYFLFSAINNDQNLDISIFLKYYIVTTKIIDNYLNSIATTLDIITSVIWSSLMVYT